MQSATISSQEPVAKPLPVISDFNRPFWEGARKHEYRLQHCAHCGKFWAPSAPVCPFCFSEDYKWDAVSGRGVIQSWVVFHKLYHPGFAKDLPYNVAFIELEEGPRVIANIVGVPNDQLKIGMKVEAVFEDINEQIAIPKFRKRAG